MAFAGLLLASGPRRERLRNEDSRADGAAILAKNLDSYRKKVNGPSGGSVDLTRTLRRIADGKSLSEAGLRPHAGDGTVFLNLEDRASGRRPLPSKPRGYYIEYVHPPPPGVRWPGPERVIVGRGGEAYYSPEHYAPDSIVALHKGAR